VRAGDPTTSATVEVTNAEHRCVRNTEPRVTEKQDHREDALADADAENPGRVEIVRRAEHPFDVVWLEGFNAGIVRLRRFHRLRRVHRCPARVVREPEERLDVFEALAAGVHGVVGGKFVSEIADDIHGNVPELFQFPAMTEAQKPSAYHIPNFFHALGFEIPRLRVRDVFLNRFVQGRNDESHAADFSGRVPVCDEIACRFPRVEVKRFANLFAAERAFGMKSGSGILEAPRAIAAFGEVTPVDRKHQSTLSPITHVLRTRHNDPVIAMTSML